jgi:hypothetical protein
VLDGAVYAKGRKLSSVAMAGTTMAGLEVVMSP